MPKNIGGGKRYKKRKNKGPINPGPITYPDKAQQYGIVLKNNGFGWLDLIVCNHDGSNIHKVLGHVRGSLARRKIRFTPGSIVVSSRREFETETDGKEKVDIIVKYFDDQARAIINSGKIPKEMIRLASSETGMYDPSNTDETADDVMDGLYVFGDEDESNIVFMDDADIGAL